MKQKKSRFDRDWKPDDDDNDCYVYRNGYWEIYNDDPEPTAEEEDAIEQAYFRRQKRIEWDYYHPGEPCPKCELE